MFMGLCAASFIPTFAYALYSKKPLPLPAKYSIVIGAIVWFLWTALVHVKESSVLGISKALFGVDAILPMPWQVVDPIVIALPVSAIALGIAIIFCSSKESSYQTADEA